MDEEGPKFKSFLGCLAHFALMAGITWAVIIGTALLIGARWCQH